jgi:hypothetical protein
MARRRFSWREGKGEPLLENLSEKITVVCERNSEPLNLVQGCSTVNTVAFDNTGALTHGQPKLTAFQPLGTRNEQAFSDIDKTRHLEEGTFSTRHAPGETSLLPLTPRAQPGAAG